MIILERFEFNSQAIRMEKRADNRIWVCLTDMAKASGKLVADWSRLKSTQEFLKDFESIMQIPIIESKVGGNIPESERGTWGLEEVAIEFAGWCSVSFKIWMLDKVKILIREGSVSLTPKPVELSRKDILVMALEAEEEKLRFQAEVERQKLLVAQKELKIQEQENVITVQGVQLLEWHPLVKNYKQFLDCDGLISFSQAGKMLNSGRNRVIKVLRLYGFLLQDKPEPYQKWMKFFKMRVKVRPHPTKSGEYKQDVVALFTPDGFNKIIKIMESKAGNQERLLEFIKSPSKLEAVILQLKEGKRDDAITAIEDVLQNKTK